MDNSIGTVLGKIEVQEILEGLGVTSDLAIVFQERVTEYAAAKGGNELTDSLFASEDFGSGQTFDSKRTALVKVPKGKIQAEVEAKLKAFPDAVIYRILSNDIMDVLSEDQKAMLGNDGNKTIEEYKEDKSVKAPNADGELEEILDSNGRVQYRSLFYSSVAKEDIDYRVAGRTSIINETELTDATAAVTADMEAEAGKM